MKSILVRWCPSLSAAVVTQLVTQVAFFSGIFPGGLSLSAQPLSAGGWPLLRDFLQGVSNLFLGGRHGTGQLGSLAPQPRRLLLDVLRLFLCVRTGHDTPLPRVSPTMHEPDRLLRRSFQVGVNLGLPRSDAARVAPE